jgi:hypothetical protein
MHEDNAIQDSDIIDGSFCLFKRAQMKNNEIVALYNNKATPDKFYAGFVISTFNEDLLFLSVTPSGKYDGFISIRSDTIFRIGIDTKYLRGIASLWEYNRTRYPEINLKTSCFTDLFLFAWTNHHVVSVELIDKNTLVNGFVDCMENGIIIINIIDEYGAQNGKHRFSVSDCAVLYYDNEDTHKIQKLAGMNQ